MNVEKATLSPHVREEIDAALKKYPEEGKRSAVFAALHAVQHEQGHLSTPYMDAVAEYLGLEPIKVYEVASFYSMYETQPVGRNSVSICRNISCMLRGADDIVAHVEKKLGVRVGETTPDGRIFLKREEECLAACAGGPMMMVNHKYYEKLTIEQVDEILDGLE